MSLPVHHERDWRAVAWSYYYSGSLALCQLEIADSLENRLDVQSCHWDRSCGMCLVRHYVFTMYYAIDDQSPHSAKAALL
jgi:hypothetical protein